MNSIFETIDWQQYTLKKDYGTFIIWYLLDEKWEMIIDTNSRWQTLWDVKGNTIYVKRIITKNRLKNFNKNS